MFLLRIPPLVSDDAVSAGVGTGEQGCMASRGLRIRIVEVAIREVSTMIEEQPEPAFPELITISFQVVAAELINDDHYDELRASIVGGGESGSGKCETKDETDYNSPSGGSHCAGSLQAGAPTAKAAKTESGPPATIRV